MGINSENLSRDGLRGRPPLRRFPASREGLHVPPPLRGFPASREARPRPRPGSPTIAAAPARCPRAPSGRVRRQQLTRREARRGRGVFFPSLLPFLPHSLRHSSGCQGRDPGARGRALPPRGGRAAADRYELARTMGRRAAGAGVARPPAPGAVKGFPQSEPGVGFAAVSWSSVSLTLCCLCVCVYSGLWQLRGSLGFTDSAPLRFSLGLEKPPE